MNKVTQAVVLDKVMNGTKLYKHSFAIQADGTEETLHIYVDIILQDKSPIVTDLTRGRAWPIVLPMLQNLGKYLHKVKADVLANDDSYRVDIYNFNELYIISTNIMIKAVGFYMWGDDIGKTYLYDEDDFVPVDGEQVYQYSIYDINKGEEIYFIEI